MTCGARPTRGRTRCSSARRSRGPRIRRRCCARSRAFRGLSVVVEIKFCGMTRAADAREAAFLGARYVGGIFAESPRQLTDEGAAAMFAGVPSGVARVGVFGAELPEKIAER